MGDTNPNGLTGGDELGRTPATDVPDSADLRQGTGASSPERERIAAEIAKLRVEASRGEVEKQKLEAEIKKIERDAHTGWLARVSPQVTAVTALLVALASIVAIVINSGMERARLEAGQFVQLVKDFSSESSSVRASAAVQLGAAATSGTTQQRQGAQALLLAATGVERAFNVRHAIEAALITLGPEILKMVQFRRTELERETKIVFGRGATPTCQSFGDTLPHLRAMQEGIMLLARVESRFTKNALDLQRAPFRCAMLLSLDASHANLQEAVFWQADLSRANLVEADLRDAQLDEADLWQADIAGAKFCGEKITGLDTRVISKAKDWDKAHFTKRFAAKLARKTGKKPLLCQGS